MWFRKKARCSNTAGFSLSRRQSSHGGLCGDGLSVPLVPQVVLHLTQQGLQLGAAYAQGHAGGEDVDDHQVQQAGHHGAVAVEAFGVVGAQVDVACAGEWRTAGGDDDGGRAILAGDVAGVHEVAGAAGVADDDHAVARAQDGGTHDLHVAVAVGGRVDAQAEELVLGVLRDDTRVTHTEKLDLPACAVGVYQGAHGLVDGHRGGVVAVLEKGGHRVVDDLDHDIAHLVIRVHAAVDEGHPFVDGTGQLELEVGQAVVAHAAAEAHDRGLADVGAVSQFADRQLGKGTWVGQAQLAHPLFGGSQGGQRCFDTVQHDQSSKRML